MNDRVIPASGIVGDDDGAFLVVGKKLLLDAINGLRRDLETSYLDEKCPLAGVSKADLALVLAAIEEWNK